VTKGRVGLHRNRWHQYAFGNSSWKPGVTTILKVQDAINGSDGLVRWAANIAARAAYDTATRPESPDFQTAVEAAFAAVDGARDRGTRIHAGIEAQIKDEEHLPTPDDGKIWYHWSRFLYKEKPEIIATERMMFHPKAGYGGTLDFDAIIRGKRSLVDVKTGSIKDTHALQLAGLSAPGSFWGEPDDPEQHDQPEYESFYVLGLSDEGYDLVPMVVGPEEYEHFLFLVETYHKLKAWTSRDRQLEAVA
jgi:hypothetical protein